MSLYVADLTKTSEWTERWYTGSGSFSLVDDYLRVEKSTDDRYLITWNNIDSDPNRADIEVLAKVRFDKQSASPQPGLCGVILRAAGSTSDITGMDLILVNAYNNTNDRRVLIDQWKAGSVAQLYGGDAIANTADTWYWVRLRANGSTMKTRHWIDGDEEPETWNISVETTLTTAGWAGFYARQPACAPYDLGYFAVGTGGDTAPSSSTGSSRVQFIGA